MDTPWARLLLLPGLEGSGALFGGLLEEFAGRFETAVATYPASCAAYDDVALLVRRLIPGSRPFVIVAESFSTPLAIDLAAEAPDQIDGLVLCNGFPANPLSAFESIMASASAPWLLRFPLTSFATRAFLVGPDASDGLMNAVLSTVALVDPAVLHARLTAVLNCDSRSGLARIRVPVLYLHATRDRLIGDAAVRELLRIKPDVVVQHVDGPHLLLQKEPKQCAQIITRFVDQIAAAHHSAART